MELFEGRPADMSGRLDKEIRTYDLLDKLGIEYERVDHEHLHLRLSAKIFSCATPRKPDFTC